MRDRHPPILPAALAALALCLLAAGCGSGGSGASSGSGASDSGGHPTRAQMQQDAVQFSACMHSHGVPDFPDPGSADFKIALAPSAAHSPAFHSALSACQHLLPGAGTQQQTAAQAHAQVVAMLAFARCMRGRGFQSFPDPTGSGEVTHEMLAKAGIDIHQPAAIQTADTCVGVTHGLLTKASVARFVAGE
jgi:hypothetical protein